MTEMDSKEISKDMELGQRRAFCKQSCTKIAQGLDKLDTRSGERAIWELFQNARDLALPGSNGESAAEIKITLTPSEFIFAHKGEPFDTDSLNSLVMQVSSQSKENEDTVGQYGTGFLTTHAFGRRLLLNGSLSMGKYSPGMYADIDRFEIDRTFNDIPEFVDKVAHQLMAVMDFANSPRTSSCREWTELCYDLSSAEGAKETAIAAMDSSVKLIPYVMTINDPVKTVILENKVAGDIHLFQKEQLPPEEGLQVMQILINHNGEQTQQKIYYLESADGEDKVILPLETPYKAKSLVDIPKLFVFFPLLGTESFGMDAVFHSKRFIPVEERSGLHLPVSNANVRGKYEQNLRVLDSLTAMVHGYYSSHSANISNWVEILGLTFDCEHHKEDQTKAFFREFKSKWSGFFQSLPVLELNGVKVSVGNSNIRFLAQDITEDIENPEYGAPLLKVVHEAASRKFSLPAMECTMNWSNVVASWDSSHGSLLGLDEIARNLSADDSIDLSLLLAFDSYLAKKGLITMFDAYPLMPNRQGVKMRRTELRNATTIPLWLGELAQGIAADKTALFCHDSFVGLADMVAFTRNDLREAINESLRRLRHEWLDKNQPYSKNVLTTLLGLSSLFASENASGVRRAALPTIASHLNEAFEPRILPPLDSNEREIAELPFKHLVESMMLEISQRDSEWVVSNMDYLVELHSALANWAEYYNKNNGEGLCVKYGAFPNRNGVPCVVRDLEKGENIPAELAEIHDVVLNGDLNERLVDERFETFYDFKPLSAKHVAQEIEDRLEEENFKHKAVLDIIDKLEDGKDWQDWFPRIHSKRAELFLTQVRKECKDSIFKLMKLDDPVKLAQLADLSGEIDLDAILAEGRAAIVQQKNREADFNFKLSLGKFVEEAIHRGLAGEISMPDIRVEEEPYGADLVIFKNQTPMYAIEVKSRWGTDQSVMMSPLQLRRSVAEADAYALVCVDMSQAGVTADEVHEYPPLEKIIPHIKVIANIGQLTKEVESIANDHDGLSVHIGGDFKCIVPQSTIRTHGIGFSEFVELLRKKIL